MRRRTNGRYAPTGDYRPFKVMIASIILAAGLAYWPNTSEAEFISPESDAIVIQREVPVEVEKIVEKPVPVPLDCDSEKCKILAKIVEVFQDEAANAITIVRKCENSTFEQSRYNDENSNGTIDYGIFQVNSANDRLCSGLDYINSWEDNIVCAKRIFDSQGGWRAWACADVVNVTPFWKE